MNAATIVALIAAVVGPLSAYLIAAKRFSGSIDNSDAAELWAESAAIRTWSQERIKILVAQIDRCDRRIDQLETRNDYLVKENLRLLDVNTELLAQVEALSLKHEEVQQRVAGLEKDAS